MGAYKTGPPRPRGQSSDISRCYFPQTGGTIMETPHAAMQEREHGAVSPSCRRWSLAHRKATQTWEVVFSRLPAPRVRVCVGGSSLGASGGRRYRTRATYQLSPLLWVFRMQRGPSGEVRKMCVGHSMGLEAHHGVECQIQQKKKEGKLGCHPPRSFHETRHHVAQTVTVQR